MKDLVETISIDPDFVERCVLELASFGAVEETGVSRTVYSPEWIGATRCFGQWCADAGLAVRHDAVGNVWGRLEGSQGGKAIVSGSHIDSQTPGGRYDGALGAISAFIAIKALKEQFGTPLRTLEAVAFCEEESSRFPNANFWGSRAISGRIRDEDLTEVRAFSGESIEEAMREAGLDPLRFREARRDDIAAFIELHIEQGPILEQAGLPVAIVDAITGIRHYHASVRGAANHAGAFPMEIRRDPMAGFAEIASGVIDTAHRLGRPAVTTVGRVLVSPNFPGIIPGQVDFTVDARHPDPVARRRLYAMHEGLMLEVAARRGLDIDWNVMIDHEPTLSDPQLLGHLAKAAASQKVPVMTMASGAAHDAQQMAAITKVAMIFVRSRDGRSHTPEEFSSVEDMVSGIKVLAAALHGLAYR
ncbi:hydantoinase/carbamoylase family amidase [Nitratireductor sp. GZWM139]|uniref:hydantoinase/carbamoylase family amidase n=1 Tax=Nitratireductor sp. GZWM139 TaxID=2950541 RepID=UPI0024BE8777|nr:hydantoinase/carbamoylase family amidase [Nitratireductor sp. GZWM139]MDJ1466124.1 hydantoinase/carbamoylase family amidase [Nitratireductor sp. GZWM139]